MSTNNIDIRYATFDYMNGWIEWSVRPSYRSFVLRFDMHEGELSEVVKGERVRLFRGSPSKAIEKASELSSTETNRWNAGHFTTIWQGFAAGYKRGKVDGCEEAMQRREAVT